jgi:ArsR family transcriptional regulator
VSRDSDCELLLILVARVFKALGEPTRLRILCALASGEQTVNGIVAAVRTPQTSVARHVQVLHQAGLARRRRDGTRVL